MGEFQLRMSMEEAEWTRRDQSTNQSQARKLTAPKNGKIPTDLSDSLKMPCASIRAQNRLIIGRSPALPENLIETILKISDPEMSRTHFEVVPEKDGLYVVRDLGSTNGVYINGSRTSEDPLVAGTEIRAGNTMFFFTGE
jgi:pSer/pThr/pTyr-binding forkhead associated (FHA) protein